MEKAGHILSEISLKSRLFKWIILFQRVMHTFNNLSLNAENLKKINKKNPYMNLPKTKGAAPSL